jgi:hypothetical protein
VRVAKIISYARILADSPTGFKKNSGSSFAWELNDQADQEEGMGTPCISRQDGSESFVSCTIHL